MGEEFDVVFIGSGPAGYVGAIKASQLGLKTACVEKENTLGGTCLNVGCIPSKALLHATELLHGIQHEGKEMGILAEKTQVHLDELMAYKTKIVGKLTSGIAFLFKKNKVTHLKGVGRILDANTIDVAGTQIKTKNIVIATGSDPIELPFLKFDEKKIVSSTGALSLTEIPKKMIVVGAGVIGLELGSVYRRMGTEVEVIEFMDRILPEFDETVSKTFQKILEGQGFTFYLKSKVVSGKVKGNRVDLQVETSEGKKPFQADVVLVSIGRKPRIDGTGVQEAKIALTERGFVQIDGNFQTSVKGVYAVGDVAGPPMLAHKGSDEAVVLAELLAGHQTTIDYAAIPNVVYTNPEIASVGFTEAQIKAKGIDYKVTNFPMVGNSRYQANGGKDPCFIKAIMDKKTGHLLGCHIVSPAASELIQGPVMAMRERIKVQNLSETIFAHPTLSEGLHEAYLGLSSKPIHI